MELRRSTWYVHFRWLRSLLPSFRPERVTGPRTPTFHDSKWFPVFCVAGECQWYDHFFSKMMI